MSPSKRPRPQPRPNHAHQEDRLPSIDHSALDPAPWCLYGPSTRSAVVRLRLGAVSSRWRAARWCSFRTPGAERAATCLQVEGESRAGPPSPAVNGGRRTGVGKPREDAEPRIFLSARVFLDRSRSQVEERGSLEGGLKAL